MYAPKNSLCSLIKPQLLFKFSYMRIFILHKAGKFWDRFQFLLLFSFYNQTFQYSILPILLFQFRGCLHANHSPFFPIPLHRPERTDFLSISHDTHIKSQHDLLIPSRIR